MLSKAYSALDPEVKQQIVVIATLIEAEAVVVVAAVVVEGLESLVSNVTRDGMIGLAFRAPLFT